MDQNEIDALMNGGGEPDDEGSGSQDSTGSADGGELTQADIDAAMSGETAPPSADDSGGGLTQADIDAALSGESGELTQADIDAAMAGGDDGETSDQSAGIFSQADIDAAFGVPGPAPEPAATDNGGGESSEFNQDDIDALMASAGDVAAEAADASASQQAQPAADLPQFDSEGKPLDELGAAMAAAIAEEKAAAEAAAQNAPPSPADLPVEEVQLPSFDQDEIVQEMAQPVSLLHDVQLHVKIELGRTNMFVEDILQLAEGSVVELDRLAGDPVDVYVNNRLVARGEVLVLNDNFCVRVCEIVSSGPDARLVG